jgi:HSP20 family protein
MVTIEFKSPPKNPDWYLLDDNESQIGNFQYRVTSKSRKWRPPTDVFETPKAIIVRVEIAGMQDGDFSVSIDDRVLSISGVRSDQSEERAYHQMEVRFGEFLTQIELNWAIEAQSVEAVYSEGFLRLVLPKAKKHKIDIRK